MCFSRSERSIDTAEPAVTVEERRSEFVERAMRFGCVMVVCLGIWLLGGAGYFWPGWVLLFGGLSLGKAARHAYGSEPSGPFDEDDARPAVDADTWTR